MAKAKTIKAAPALKSEGGGGSGQEVPAVTREYITIRGKLATYVISADFQSRNFMAYIKDIFDNEYDVDTDMTAY